jgi:multidrug efflux pump subunit AcrA (membrane-fusion protein)
VIALSNYFNKPVANEAVADIEPKPVRVYRLKDQPYLQVQAQVRKTGVVQITAQSSGIVSNIKVKTGQRVGKGNRLLNLVSNYQGGNAAGVQAQLAKVQYQNAVDTFDQQARTIDQQKRAAELSKENVDQLRDIANRASEDSRALIDLNNEILGKINDNLHGLVDNNVNNQNDELIFQTRQLKSQYEGAQIQLKAGLRSSEYQADVEKPPADLADLQQQITINQLELQQKGLELNKKVSYLQLQLAQVSAGMFNPASPVNGVVEYVHVVTDETVSPGRVLVTIKADNQETELVALVTGRVARQVSRIVPSNVILPGRANIEARSYEILPNWISQEAVSDHLYAITYSLPGQFQPELADGEYLGVKLPLEIERMNGEIPIVPLDAVYQTQTQSYVLVVEEDSAVSRPVVLGEVVGEFVYVAEGLVISDLVIMDRGVVAGDRVAIDHP